MKAYYFLEQTSERGYRVSCSCDKKYFDDIVSNNVRYNHFKKKTSKVIDAKKCPSKILNLINKSSFEFVRFIKAYKPTDVERK